MSMVIIVSAALLILVVFIFLKLFQSSQESKIPGLSPLSKEDGNFGDMKNAGSFHQFLSSLHQKFGPVASFWYGPTWVVSVGDPALYQKHAHWSNRPYLLYKLFEPIYGAKSYAFDNGPEFKIKKSAYDKCLSLFSIKTYFSIFQKYADDMEHSWAGRPTGEHISLTKNMSAYSLKCVLGALYGESLPEDQVYKFKEVYDKIWSEMELRLTSPPTPEREEAFQKGRRQLQEISEHLIENRKQVPTDHVTDEQLLDVILRLTDDEEQQFDDCMTFIIAGFHTTGNMLTWAFYFLGMNPDIQEKVYQEINEVIQDQTVDQTNIGDLVYTRQVLDETLRCSVLAPWSARFLEEDSVLCGYKIPANTPVVHALGVGFEDETIWPSPHKFDPERFSPENSKKRYAHMFVPFGFAGKHTCPGQRFGFAEATVALVTLIRKFKVVLVEGQAIERVYGFVTHPNNEVWITVTSR